MSIRCHRNLLAICIYLATVSDKLSGHVHTIKTWQPYHSPAGPRPRAWHASI